ncbi:MAG: restriction endonuclease [Pyrinomonadaceae bacterium]
MILFVHFFAFAADASFECCILPILLIVVSVLYGIFSFISENNDEKQKREEIAKERERTQEEEARRSNERAVLETIEYRAFLLKKEQFQGDEAYKLVEQFAKKFGSGSNDKEITKLEALLAARGWVFTNPQIKELVGSEAKRHVREKAKLRLLNTQSFKRDVLIENYLELYSPDDREMLPVLGEILKEKGHFEFFDNDLGVLRLHLMQSQKDIELKVFERRLNSDDDQIVSLEIVDKLNGYEFETFLKDLFSRMGYKVEQTKLTGDQGADVVVVKFGEKTVIQAKRFQGNVGNYAVQEIMAAISLYRAQRGMVVTNSYFTSSAKQLAMANDIELVDRDGLEKLIRENW